jgi:amino acid transporter
MAGLHVNPPYFAAVFAAVVTLYFWRKNIIGIHESSEKALRIMQITTVMVVILIVWCLVTIFKNGYQPVPLPVPANSFQPRSAGLAAGTVAPSITVIAIMIGLGHSLLAMSGEESLAQVNREIAHPKLKNLERAGFVIFIYSMLFTSLVSFFAVMIIPTRAPEVPGQPDRRPLHVPGRADIGAPAVPWLRGAGRHADSGRRGEHGHHRLQRRAEPRGRRRRAARLVPHPHKKFGTTRASST